MILGDLKGLKQCLEGLTVLERFVNLGKSLMIVMILKIFRRYEDQKVGGWM